MYSDFIVHFQKGFGSSAAIEWALTCLLSKFVRQLFDALVHLGNSRETSFLMIKERLGRSVVPSIFRVKQLYALSKLLDQIPKIQFMLYVSLETFMTGDVEEVFVRAHRSFKKNNPERYASVWTCNGAP